MDRAQYRVALGKAAIAADPLDTWNTRYREALERNGLCLVHDATRALPTWCVHAPRAVEGWDSWDAQTRIAPRPALGDDYWILGAVAGVTMVTLLLWVLGGLKW